MDKITDFWIQIFHNRVLISGIVGSFSAQIIKTIIYALINRKLDLSRLVGDGGMPSAHASTVCCMAATAGITCGVGSPVFAVAVIFAFVTMRDALGVRRQAGKHAVVLNQLIEIFDPTNELLPEQRLKEFVGHTPMQVLTGAVWGIAMALLMNLFFA